VGMGPKKKKKNEVATGLRTLSFDKKAQGDAEGLMTPRKSKSAVGCRSLGAEGEPPPLVGGRRPTKMSKNSRANSEPGALMHTLR